MSTYKVIQDIEAEDHILGPLSLRQFIYGLVSAFFLYLSFICLTKHAAVLLVLFLPPAIFAGFFAFPFGKDQPTEIWALAKLRFLFKPRKRIWNQSGVKELVTITVPKRIEIQRTNGLNQNEVKSRLEALANTIDSRGWAIKNVNASMYAQSVIDNDSDRLVSLSSLPQAVPDYDVADSDDMLDEKASPLAQQFTRMIKTSTKTHRDKLLHSLSDSREAAAQPTSAQKWFSHPPLGTPSRPATEQPVAAGLAAGDPTPIETALAAEAQEHLAAGAQANARLHKLQPKPVAADPLVATDDQPAAEQPAANSAVATTDNRSQTTSPAGQDAAILKLANNNDLNVATLAREAGKVKDLGDSGDEVVIALH